MRAKLLARIHVYDDEDELVPLSVPPDSRREVVADGYQERSAGKFRLLGGASLTIPLGSVAVVRGWMIRVEGEDGVNLVINGGTARQIRPFSDAATAAESTPVGYALETSDNVSSLVITHPGDGDSDPVSGTYELIGDPVA